MRSWIIGWLQKDKIMKTRDKRIDSGKAFDWGRTSKEYDLIVPFTRESWHGRMKACRGVGASLSEEELDKWDREHRGLLNKVVPEQFEVLHYASLAILRKPFS